MFKIIKKAAEKIRSKKGKPKKIKTKKVKTMPKKKKKIDFSKVKAGAGAIGRELLQYQQYKTTQKKAVKKPAPPVKKDTFNLFGKDIKKTTVYWTGGLLFLAGIGAAAYKNR